MSDLIGRVDYKVLGTGEPDTLLLRKSGDFVCGDPLAAAVFESMLKEYQNNYSPADGWWGVSLLQQFAQRVHGKVLLAPMPDSPPGTIY